VLDVLLPPKLTDPGDEVIITETNNCPCGWGHRWITKNKGQLLVSLKKRH